MADQSTQQSSAQSGGFLQSIIQLLTSDTSAQAGQQQQNTQAGQKDGSQGQQNSGSVAPSPVHIIIPAPLSQQPTGVTNGIFGQGQLIAPQGLPPVPNLSDILNGINGKSKGDAGSSAGGLADVLKMFTGGGKGDTSKGDNSTTNKTSDSDALDKKAAGGSDLSSKIAMLAKLAQLFAAG